MKKIIVSGLINVETTLLIKEFPIPYFPIDYPFNQINTSVSGVGLNIAKALTTLDCEVSLFSLLGNDPEAKRIHEDLISNKIKTKYIQNVLQATPQTIVLYDKQGRREIYCDLKDIQEKSYDYLPYLDEIKQADLVVLCNINFNRALIPIVNQFNKRIATDVHVLSDLNDSYNKDFLECADIIFLSDENIGERYLRFLKEMASVYHPEIIVLGRGSKGAFLYARDEGVGYEIDAIQLREIKSTVGAGDALFSAFNNFYLKGFSPLESLKRAIIFASYKIGETSASLGFLQEKRVEEIYQHVNFVIRTYSFEIF